MPIAIVSLASLLGCLIVTTMLATPTKTAPRYTVYRTPAFRSVAAEPSHAKLLLKSMPPAAAPSANNIVMMNNKPNEVMPEYYISASLPVASQGVVRIKMTNPMSKFRIYINSKSESSAGVTPLYCLEVNETSVILLNHNNDALTSVLASTSDRKAVREKNNDVYYWLSLDKKNSVLKYGKGEATQALTLLRYDVPVGAFLPDLKYVGLSVSDTKIMTKVLIYELPVTFQLPPNVISSDLVTLDDIENGLITTIGNLPTECQMLYSVVAGPNVVLQNDIATAIQLSLKSGELSKFLVKKAQDHKCKLTETYIRVTLGMDQGYSPGIPFVLELWPTGHNSPIHQHSGAFAVIKVLHGSINCTYYSDLNPAITTPYLDCNFPTGGVTYLTPSLYQTHMLKNKSTTDFCATIQCYRYASDDTTHYEYFDYLDDNNKRSRFAPSTDFTYTELKNLLKKEGLLKKMK
ncbi:hypothetical protein SAMD00019534_109500 [Acytostelium subglobosum LB1]|uniref:hypothetical protein n=1 Tax=Acytostelium subglobosum LB1 TaxID=1410327 RepID=UPI0006449CA3|nr:hypothetical protein SAMD00019534_109500 [Acytostelium subglobosum LB1]GAM27774.1 hypothetical protein SAMD00019534_109500 [Acytostelium subglobosum LB1]|eukprot:XP_012749433.1 hypothetical protein SAMD00019534_109500 [Acytostelium subglobosum LB1]